MKLLYLKIDTCDKCPYLKYIDFDDVYEKYCSQLGKYITEFGVTRVSRRDVNGEEYFADLIVPPDDCPLPDCDTPKPTNVSEIIGKWPGDETDAEFDAMMREHTERD